MDFSDNLSPLEELPEPQGNALRRSFLPKPRSTTFDIIPPPVPIKGSGVPASVKAGRPPYVVKPSTTLTSLSSSPSDPDRFKPTRNKGQASLSKPLESDVGIKSGKGVHQLRSAQIVRAPRSPSPFSTFEVSGGPSKTNRPEVQRLQLGIVLGRPSCGAGSGFNTGLLNKNETGDGEDEVLKPTLIEKGSSPTAVKSVSFPTVAEQPPLSWSSQSRSRQIHSPARLNKSIPTKPQAETGSLTTPTNTTSTVQKKDSNFLSASIPPPYNASSSSSTMRKAKEGRAKKMTVVDDHYSTSDSGSRSSSAGPEGSEIPELTPSSGAGNVSGIGTRFTSSSLFEKYQTPTQPSSLFVNRLDDQNQVDDNISPNFGDPVPKPGGQDKEDLLTGSSPSAFSPSAQLARSPPSVLPQQETILSNVDDRQVDTAQGCDFSIERSVEVERKCDKPVGTEAAKELGNISLELTPTVEMKETSLPIHNVTSSIAEETPLFHPEGAEIIDVEIESCPRAGNRNEEVGQNANSIEGSEKKKEANPEQTEDVIGCTTTANGVEIGVKNIQGVLNPASFAGRNPPPGPSLVSVQHNLNAGMSSRTSCKDSTMATSVSDVEMDVDIDVGSNMKSETSKSEDGPTSDPIEEMGEFRYGETVLEGKDGVGVDVETRNESDISDGRDLCQKDIAELPSPSLSLHLSDLEVVPKPIRETVDNRSEPTNDLPPQDESKNSENHPLETTIRNGNDEPIDEVMDSILTTSVAPLPGSNHVQNNPSDMPNLGTECPFRSLDSSTSVMVSPLSQSLSSTSSVPNKGEEAGLPDGRDLSHRFSTPIPVFDSVSTPVCFSNGVSVLPKPLTYTPISRPPLMDFSNLEISEDLEVPTSFPPLKFRHSSLFDELFPTEVNPHQKTSLDLDEIDPLDLVSVYERIGQKKFVYDRSLRWGLFLPEPSPLQKESSKNLNKLTIEIPDQVERRMDSLRSETASPELLRSILAFLPPSPVSEFQIPASSVTETSQGQDDSPNGMESIWPRLHARSFSLDPDTLRGGDLASRYQDDHPHHGRRSFQMPSTPETGSTYELPYDRESTPITLNVPGLSSPGSSASMIWEPESLSTAANAIIPSDSPKSIPVYSSERHHRNEMPLSNRRRRTSSQNSTASSRVGSKTLQEKRNRSRSGSRIYNPSSNSNAIEIPSSRPIWGRTTGRNVEAAPRRQSNHW